MFYVQSIYERLSTCVINKKKPALTQLGEVQASLLNYLS
jgi:hypothetical protein